MKVKKALVIGLGSIGVRHLNNLYKLGIKDLSAFRIRKLQPHLDLIPKDIKIFYDYQKALDNNPDIVVISNPTYLHIPYAIEAIKNGCHVYLEKPISNSLNRLDELIKFQNKQKSIVTIGCQLRFHTNLEEIKKWLDNGLLGEIIHVKVETGEYLPSWHPWEDYRKSYASQNKMGGGVVLTMIHDLDYLYWLFGKMKSVYAIGGHLTPLEIDAEDTALISLLTDSNIPIHLSLDYWQKPPIRILKIVGEKGIIFWDYYKGEAILMHDGKVVKESNINKKWERNDMFLSIMKNFIDAINNNDVIRSPLNEGIDTLKISLAILKSMGKNKVIKL